LVKPNVQPISALGTTGAAQLGYALCQFCDGNAGQFCFVELQRVQGWPEDAQQDWV
jgi:hypothetical protein